ncbi:molybdopterin molybdenumtransferase MoeA [Mycetohabitans sp. B5]|uniref:Molybdopterin molybdenumtransferase n=1 Tax=Mycetohabitans endofungorum TaxID=417203 RepID=A0A2P5KEL4_9BURK|nr:MULTISPECIES: gephyrin-like molybdotransferase Glp [Mycetohabitans]MCG1053969.1 molybdopterin molybdenumtransferase MoeA [Mycetohabitans sp. B5]PPB85138.1 molybdopterin molybdochelatase [Mycetohabitans endofungorum]
MTSLQTIASCIADYDPNALPVNAARAIVSQWATPVATIERLALRDALDRVLADDVVSPLDVPAHDNSAMDGYAFDGATLERGGTIRLRVAGTALAGRAYDARVRSGDCIRVMTGAILPADCDTVIPQEQVAINGDGSIQFLAAALARGANRRRAGEDLRSGHAALLAGRVLRASDLGLLASLGLGEVPVRRRLRAAFFSTGDELRSLGQPLAPGCVYDSNRYTLYGMLRRLNVEVIDLGVVPDDRHALEAALRNAAASADVVLSSGGVSVGDADYTRELMGRLGDVAFWSIAMRPGRPFAFGRIWSGKRVGEGHDALYFGLPGNPVATMVAFYQIVRDALISMTGALPRPVPLIAASALDPISKRPGRTEYQRGIARRRDDGRWEVALTGAQGSGILRSMSDANCFVILDHQRGPVAVGDTVDIMPFDGLI